MKSIKHRKLLRLSTVVALTVGLSLSTSAIASPPASEHLLAQADEAQPQQPTTQAQDDQAQVDLPGEIEDFNELVERWANDDFDTIYEYIDEGTASMADAIGALLPDDDDALKSDVDGWKDRLEVLGTEERPDYASLTQVLFTEGVDLLEQVQQAHYPGQAQPVDALRSAANNLDDQTDIEEQSEAVHSYFSNAATAVEEMYRSQEDEATSSRQSELILVSSPTRYAQAETQPQQQDDDEGGFFDWGFGDGVPGDVEDFDEFVQEHRQEGIGDVVEYSRDGAENFHDAMEAILDEQEGENQLVRDQLASFEESVNALEDVTTVEFPSRLVNTLNEGTQILTTIQQEHYPQFESQVIELRNAIGQLDPEVAIGEQTSAVESVYIQASTALRTMAESDLQEDEPVSLALGGGTIGEEQEHTTPEQENGMGGGPEIAVGVQEYLQYVDNLRQDGLEQQGEESTVQGFTLMSNAMAGIIEASSPQGIQQQPGLPDPQPESDQPPQDLEPIQFNPDEQQDPGQQPLPETGPQEQPRDTPRVAERENLDEQHQAFNDQIEELRSAVGQEQFPRHLKSTMESAVQLLTDIQQQDFPEFDLQIQQVQIAAEDFDAEQTFEDQTQQVMTFFTSTSQALEEMEMKLSEELQVSLIGLVLR